MKKTNITQLCEFYKIANFSINDDYTVDVQGSVDLKSQALIEIPFKFNSVTGNFNCSKNKLISLKGVPNTVGGDFCCFSNNLVNLAGSPNKITGDFYAYDNPLKTLIGSPRKLTGNFCIGGTHLTNLIGCPPFIGGVFSFDGSLISTYSNDIDIEILGDVNLNNGEFNHQELPCTILKNRNYLKIILKYQNYYSIWNHDETFNEANFEIMLEDIIDNTL